MSPNARHSKRNADTKRMQLPFERYVIICLSNVGMQKPVFVLPHIIFYGVSKLNSHKIKTDRAK